MPVVIVGDNEALVNKIEVLVNDMVSMHCYTNASIDIQWHFNSFLTYVSAGGRLRHPYNERFRTEDDNAGTYTLIIPKVRSEDAGWYYCQGEISGRLISSTQLTVLYFSSTSDIAKKYVNDNVNCSESSNPNVKYNWALKQNKKVAFWSSNQCLPIQKPGNYHCEGNCSIRNYSCLSMASVMNVFVESTNGGKISGTTALAIILPTVVLFAVLSPGMFMLMRKRRQESTKKNTNSKDSEEKRWKFIIDCHHDFIVDRMSPDFGLIDKLYSNSAITESEKEEIEAENVVHRRNENLIKCLGKNLKLGMLIQVLRESDQKHLVKYLENDGKYSDEFDGEMPLTEKEILQIKSNYESLIDLIEMSDLAERLYSTGVINKRQREFIFSKSTSYEKNKALLEILRTGSLHFYSQTINCLQNSNQGHIAEILEKGGVAVRLDANLEMKNMDIGRLEEEIALQINCVLRIRPIEELNLILDRVLGLKLIAAKKGHSVSLYFLCNQSNEVDFLEELATDGQLNEITEDLFNQVTKTQETIEISFNWTPDVFDKSREAIQDMKNSGILQISRSMETLSACNYQQDSRDEANDAGSKQENERIRNGVVAIYEDFVSEVDPKKILDFLVQNKIVNLKQRHYLKNQATKEDRCKALLDLLFSCSKDNVFIILKEALKEHYPGIVERIDSPTTDDEVLNNSNRRSTMRLESSIIVFVKEYNDGREIISYNTEIDTLKINLNSPEDVSVLPQLPIRVYHGIAAAVYCGSVFVTGIGKDKDEIWRLDARNSEWNKCASMIKGRFGHSVAFVDQILYVCGGGRSYYDVFDDVEAYDAIDDKCSAVGKLKYAVTNAGNCVPYKASLYIFGGSNAQGEKVNIVQMYNRKLNSCTILTNPMPREEEYLRAALLQNYVILLGENSCFLYNFDTETWEVRDQFNTGVEFFGMTVHNEKLFVIGGRDSEGINRDDIRYVSILNNLDDEPIEWKLHAKLSKPIEVHAFGKLEFLVKQI